MNFTVVWGVDASEQVTREMLAANSLGRDLAPVVAAVAAMNRELAVDAHQTGESREAGVRVHAVDGLTAYFEPYPDVGFVFVRRGVFHPPRPRP